MTHRPRMRSKIRKKLDPKSAYLLFINALLPTVDLEIGGHRAHDPLEHENISVALSSSLRRSAPAPAYAPGLLGQLRGGRDDVVFQPELRLRQSSALIVHIVENAGEFSSVASARQDVFSRRQDGKELTQIYENRELKRFLFRNILLSIRR
ncbi:hypothetical protein EVAR_67359_1 [Eumeta japonica]|uniref:Uncharacterized protein n=1 Tax=Eumeta variegata TaxID=151549 RepID=A0A4C2AH21_EUMVA|nr:hypothetical protein EVAR_67359_1 [Eumeta japonica]